MVSSLVTVRSRL